MKALQWIVAAGALAVLAGCASPPGTGGTAGPPVAAPTLKVGDRWVYRGKDGYRVPVLWEETHEIVATDRRQRGKAHVGPSVSGYDG